MSRYWRLYFAALLVAVTSLSTVGFLTNRVAQSLTLEKSSALAADLVLERTEAIPNAWRERAEQQGLRTALITEFPSVIFIGDDTQLVQVKGVSDNYPLRGQLQWRGDAFYTQPPYPGQVILAPELESLVQQQDISLGELTLKPSGYIVDEPDIGMNFFRLAPKVIAHHEDVLNSGLIGPASRVKYRLLVAGNPQQLDTFRNTLTPQLEKNDGWLEPTDGRPELQTAIQRGEKFINLSALSASIVGGVAIILALQLILSESLYAAAIFRALGMSSQQVLWRYLRKLLGITLLATASGILIGYGLQWSAVQLASDWIGNSLPAAEWAPAIPSIIHALILSLGLSLPGLWAIRTISPNRLLRNETRGTNRSQWLLGGSVFITYALLVAYQAEDISLAAILLGALITITLGLMVILRLFQALIQRIKLHGAVGFGLGAIKRRPGIVMVQISGLSIALCMLLILNYLRTDLYQLWSTSLPTNTPNHFLLNVLPTEKDRLIQQLQQNDIAANNFFATTRARLSAINGQAINLDQFDTDRGKRLASREYSLGFHNQFQNDNRIIAGNAWRKDQKGFSVEQGLAQSLNLKLGDELTFRAGAINVSAPILSIRSVKWDSFNVNFFVQGTENLTNEVPHAFISSVYVATNKTGTLQKLLRDYPSVSSINLTPLIDKVKGVLDRGLRAVQGVFSFTLIGAIVLLLVSIETARRQRAKEVATLRTLGASKRFIVNATLAEFAFIGSAVGLLAASLAHIAATLIAQRLLGLTLGIPFSTWLSSVAIGTSILLVIGWLSERRLLKQPPTQQFRS